MRIILIQQHDPSASHVGGIGTFLNTFIRYAPENYEVSLVGITADPKNRPLGQWQDLKVRERSYKFLPVVAAEPPYRGKFPLSLQFMMGLVRYRHLIDFKDAILEYHRIEPSFVLRDLKNPKMLLLHGHMKDLRNPQTEVKWGKWPSLYFWLEGKVVSEMKRVYIVREDAIPDYQARFPQWRDRFHFLPTWVDDRTFICMEETERKNLKENFLLNLGLEPQSKLCLFIGRFEGQKDPFLLLESFKWLSTKINAVLVLVGAGKLEKSIREFIETQGLSKKVRIVSPQPQLELVKWMNVADSLCLSSAFEGMPRVVVESLQCGLPVVSTDAGEAKRLVGDGTAGRLVTERTPAAFGGALLEVLQNPPGREACRKKVAPFQARDILKSVYSYYDNVMKSGA